MQLQCKDKLLKEKDENLEEKDEENSAENIEDLSGRRSMEE